VLDRDGVMTAQNAAGAQLGAPTPTHVAGASAPSLLEPTRRVVLASLSSLCAI